MASTKLPDMRRRAFKLGLRETARKMGISHTYLRDMERGDRNASEEMLRKYREATTKPNVRVVV